MSTNRTGVPLGTPAGEPAKPRPATKNLPSRKRGSLRGKGPALIAAGITGLLGFGGIVFAVNAAQTPTVEVYRTAMALAANQQVTANDVEVVEIPETELSPDMLTMEDLQDKLWFAKVGVPAGTPLSRVVFDTATRTNIELPDGFVLASFEAEPASAVAGKIQAGDYINITAVGQLPGGGGKVARVILQRILVLDANVGAQTQTQTAGQPVDASQLPGPENPLVYGGVPTLYTVAVTNEQAAILALSRSSDLYVTLTTANATDELNVSVSEPQVFGGGAVAPGVVDLVPSVTSEEEVSVVETPEIPTAPETSAPATSTQPVVPAPAGAPIAETPTP